MDVQTMRPSIYAFSPLLFALEINIMTLDAMFIFAAQFGTFHFSLQKWFSMGFVASHSVKHVNYVNLS